MNRLLVLICFLAFLNTPNSFAQCCSMGNPLAGLAKVDDTVARQLQLNVYFKHGYNDTYFRKNVKLINYGIYSESGYDFVGLAISYAVNGRFTLEHENGYYLRKEIRYINPELDALVKNGYGWSNGMLGFKYMLVALDNERVRVYGGAGIKYPYSRELFSIQNVDLPIELQPSTGAWGYMGQLLISKQINSTSILSLGHRSEFNLKNKFDYQYGSMHTSILSLDGKLNRNVFYSAGVRSEYKVSDKTPTNAKLASEGSNLLILAPRIGYSLKGFSIALFGDVPVYKYYFGEQLSIQYAVGLSVSKSLSLARK